MEASSTSTSRFRFRDLPEKENNSSHSDTSSIASSSAASTNHDDEDYDLQSMTARGIKHLCSELIELKVSSSEDFHSHIYANYSSFVRVFEEVGRLESELMQLKNHVSSQKRILSELVDGVYSRFLSKESMMDLVIEESEWDEEIPRSGFEAHVNDVLETLDVLLCENRIDEALAMLELEDVNLQRMEFVEGCSVEELGLFESAISERKGLIAQRLTMVAENPRISAAELQTALVGLCRLCENHLATSLLLKYYHSRIASLISNLKASKSLLDRVYIRELSKFVFSMISQAARSFVMLYGETSPYAPEFIKWSREETKGFAACFHKYIKSISEVSGGLSTAVEAVQFAVSFCSLLEAQRLMLRPYFVKHIRPCLEDVLNIHVDHLTKVIGIFTATDTWVLGRYLVAGIMNEQCSSVVVGQQPEYCLFTNSGRKFVTLLQAITVDVSPLLSLEIEGSILSGLMNLFKKYTDILERAINCDTMLVKEISSKINLAESVQQQVSILVNLSSLEQLFSNIVRSIFKGASDTSSEIRESDPNGYQHKEVDRGMLFIREASPRLRSLFCEQFIYRVMSGKTSYRLPEICIDSHSESGILQGGMPSLPFQVLFLELRILENFSEDNVFEAEWLMELLGDLIDAAFVWISNNKELWYTNEDDTTENHTISVKQFVLDVQFLVEITKYGGYFSSNPTFLMNLMKSAFVSAGLNPRRDVNDDAWAIDVAAETIQNLLEIEEEQENASEEIAETPNNVAEDSVKSAEHEVASDDSEIVINDESAPLNTSRSLYEEVTRLLEEGYVELDERAAASYDEQVHFYAETTSSSLEAEPSESKHASDTSANNAARLSDDHTDNSDAASPSENYTQLTQDVTARHDPQFDTEN